MRVFLRFSFVVAVLLVVSSLASADLIDNYATYDTWIGDNSGINHGGDTNLQVREESGGGATPRRYALVGWDLTSLAGATINSVEMWFYTTAASTTLYPSAYRVTSAWDENAATYTKRTATQNWTTAGVDYDAVAPANLVWNVFVNQYKSVIQGGTDVDFTAMVQDWVNNPGTNYGIMVKRPADSGARQGSFSSSEANSAYLRIDYTPVPEPATLLLLSTASVILIRRKGAAKVK